MKLLVLDGNSIVNRAYYGIRMLTTKDGLYTNGIYGFLTMLRRMEEEEAPDAVAIAFDLRAPTFRHKAYADYKGTRKGMPEELAQQMPLLKELLGYLGYPMVTCEGYEADDILGTLARVCRESGQACVLATGDRDSLQLVGGSVTVRLASTKMGQPVVTRYDEAKILEEYGVTPPQLIDIKALMGDPSDNIPGVSGIGQKGASQLIQAHGSIEYLYENLETLDLKPAMRKKLEAGRESAQLSYLLGKICTEAPIDTDLSHYLPKPVDREKAAALMTRLELFKLMEKLELRAQPEAAPAAAEQTYAVHCPSEKELLEQLQRAGKADFLYTLDHDGALTGLCFAVENTLQALSPSAEFLQTLFAMPQLQLCTHDVKPLYRFLDSLGIYPAACTNDLLLAGYLLNPSASDYALQRLYAVYRVTAPAVPDDALPPALSQLAPLLSDVAALPALREAMMTEIVKNEQETLLQSIELPLALVLARMENIGFFVDKESIVQYGIRLDDEIARLQSKIYEQAGHPFNINSPKQLGVVLFEELQLPHGKKTKTGYSTSAEVLENLQNEFPIVADILEYRTVAKLKSTYCDGLLKEIAADGRIHSVFKQAETRTGRISSTEPNLQNIPVRTEIGRELRRFFRAEPGKVLIDADYSQIELRVLAHVAGDETMAAAFRNHEDIHRSTAAQVFGLPEELVTPLMRSRAKAVNFGIVYGIGAFSLAKDLHITRKEAEAYIQSYLEHYPGVRSYMERVVEQATEQGYAETIFGRRRYLPELTASNFNLRSFGQRVAKNMPIQGTAADIIKIAMIRVERRLREEQLEARLILQVHDELIVEAPEAEQERVLALLTEEMEGAVSLSVPMLADAHAGETWYDAKG